MSDIDGTSSLGEILGKALGQKLVYKETGYPVRSDDIIWVDGFKTRIDGLPSGLGEKVTVMHFGGNTAKSLLFSIEQIGAEWKES